MPGELFGFLACSRADRPRRPALGDFARDFLEGAATASCELEGDVRLTEFVVFLLWLGDFGSRQSWVVLQRVPPGFGVFDHLAAWIARLFGGDYGALGNPDDGADVFRSAFAVGVDVEVGFRVLGTVDQFVRFVFLEEVVGRRLTAFGAGVDFFLFGGELGRRVLGRKGSGEDQLLVRSVADAATRGGPFFVRLRSRAFGRFLAGMTADRKLAADQVRFPVVEVETGRLRRTFGCLADARRARDADLDLVVPDLGDFDLRDAELVAAGADDVDRAFHRAAVDRRLLGRRPRL